MLAIVDSHARVSRAEVHTDDQWLLSSLTDVRTDIKKTTGDSRTGIKEQRTCKTITFPGRSCKVLNTSESKLYIDPRSVRILPYLKSLENMREKWRPFSLGQIPDRS